MTGCKRPWMEVALAIEIVVLDLGGVLVELGGVDELGALIGEQDEAEVWRRWLNSEWVRRYERGRCSRGEFAKGMIQENHLDLTPEEFLARFLAWPRGLFPGAASLIHSVRPDLEIACLSNTNELHWQEQRDAEQVHRLFEKRFLSHEIDRVKPDLEIFAWVTSELCCSAESIFFLDDNLINVEGARAAGWQAERVLGVEEARLALEQRALLR